jgi:hypothetical protein
MALLAREKAWVPIFVGMTVGGRPESQVQRRLL